MENSPETQSNKWLIIFLIYADFTTKKDPDDIQKLVVMVNSMLSDIITTPIIPDQSRMFVVMNSIKFVFNDPKNGIDDKCAFYTIERTLDGTQNYIASCEIIDNSTYYTPGAHGGQILQKPLQLKSVLEKTCIKADEEVFLITWDHGSSFGIFRAVPPVANAISVQDEVEKALPLYPYLKMFWDKAEESFKKNNNQDDTAIELIPFRCPEWKEQEKTLKKVLVNQPSSLNQPQAGVAEILKNSELNEALQAWLGDDRKVAVLLMANCWMMNMHTMYALRNSVQCLVAPQGNIDCPGYNIKDILIEINKTNKIGGMAPVKLAEICVTTIDNDYSKAKAAILNSVEPDVIERFKIFAVDLSKKQIGNQSCLEKQIESFDTLCKHLAEETRVINNRQDLIHFFKYIRSVSFDFSRNMTKTIDIINWIKAIQQADFSLRVTMLSCPVRNSIAAVLDSVSRSNNIVLKSSSGKKIYVIEGSKDYWATIGLPPTGYSLFFPMIYPSINLDLLNLIDNVSTDELLVRLRNWRNFLVAIDSQLSIFVPPLP